MLIEKPHKRDSRSQWPRGLRLGSAAACLLRLWVGIPSKAWMSVCCKCCVLSGGGLCDELITRPEKSYRLRCVVVCDLETSWMRRPWPNGGCHARNKQTNKRYKFSNRTSWCNKHLRATDSRLIYPETNISSRNVFIGTGSQNK